MSKSIVLQFIWTHIWLQSSTSLHLFELVLKSPTPRLNAGTGPEPDVLAGLVDILLLHVVSILVHSVHQLIQWDGRAPSQLWQTHWPEPIVQRRQTGTSGWPGSGSKPADDPVTKLGRKPLSDQKSGMACGSILLGPQPLPCDHSPLGNRTGCSMSRYRCWFMLSPISNQWRITWPLMRAPQHITFLPPWTLFSSSTSGSQRPQYLSFCLLGLTFSSQSFSSDQMTLWGKSSGWSSNHWQKLTLPCLWASVKGYTFFGL